MESQGVGRFKVKEVSQVDGYDSSTYTAIIDNPPRLQDHNRLADLSNKVSTKKRLYFSLKQINFKVHDKANEWFSSLPEEMSAALVRHFGPMPPRTDDHAEFEVSKLLLELFSHFCKHIIYSCSICSFYTLNYIFI